LTLLSGLAVIVPGEAAAIIQIDRGISGVRIDNTKRQVRAALGTPKSIDHGSNDFGPFTEFRYAGKIRVLFSGGNRVTLVSTRGLGDRTARGVGVGSTRRAVRNRVPGVTCEPPSIGLRVCLTGQNCDDNGRVENHHRITHRSEHPSQPSSSASQQIPV